VTLVRQPRIGPMYVGEEAMLLEAPAGLTDGEAPEEAGKREVEEETGLRLHEMESVGAHWSMPGCATERMHVFLAAYGPADRVSNGGGVAHEHEEIEVVELPFVEALAMIRDGRICDMKTVMVLQSLALGHLELD
jgi:nudix-type nucleoside diphosphatase (YffH/AdpP family)